MKEILADIERWIARDEEVAVATVIQTWGSSPRRVGAKMAVSAGGQIAGSVSGGCVESAVIETAYDVIKTGQPQRLHFGVSDENAWEVGLACGGSIEVFVQRLDPDYLKRVRDALREEQAFVTATIIDGEWIGRQMIVYEDGQTAGSLSANQDEAITAAACEALRAEQSVLLSEVDQAGVFLDVSLPAPEVIVVGGVHTAVVLTQIAKVMGYRTTLVDPREAFNTEERFPHVDHRFRMWPDKAFAQIRLSSRSAVVMLTHDPKIDDPALKAVLPSAAFYVGALGSRKTQAERRQRMLEAGISEANLDRLHGPVGLDLGGQKPEEIALAIIAEIVAVRNRKTEAAH